MIKPIVPYFKVLRPYQWSKNLLIFCGIIFSITFFNIENLLLSIGAFISFCLGSSGIYILNDVRDIKNDRKHPEKKKRPIASGAIPVSKALALMSILLLTSLLFAFFLNKGFFIILLIYIILNTAYSFGLKNVVILDAMIVAMGFLLRAIAGCAIIRVDISPWLFICSLMLALVLSFGKRRNELNVLHDDASAHRSSLKFYTVQLLDIILTICSASAIVTYSLYTMASDTINRFESKQLIMTTPFVLFGVFRYLYLIYTQNKGGDPTKLIAKDLPTIINAILWLLCVLYVIYGVKILHQYNLYFFS